jgi:hypothetical protein
VLIWISDGGPQLELYIGDAVDITRNHIPPEEKLHPPAEYTYLPGESAPSTIPPVGSSILMHFYHNPACADTESAHILRLFPQKLNKPLKRGYEGASTGWGLHFQEGWHWNEFCVVGLILLVVASIVFGIAWSILDHDVQGAFGISGYILAFAVFGSGAAQAVLLRS